jgi:spermidine synthase
MLSYHYVFAVISFALLGLGVGGMLLKRWSGWWPRTGYHTNAALFALLIAGSVIGIIKLPIYESDVLVNFGFWIYILLATLPFFFAGLTLAGLFQEFAERSSLLYGADLIGAMLGALTVVPLLNGMGGVNSALLTAVTAALGSMTLAWSQRKPFSLGFASFIGLTLGVITLGMFGLEGEVPITKDLNKDMYRALANPLDKAEVVESRWSAFGRTDLVRSDLSPNDMTIFVDGGAGSAMYNLDSLMNNPAQKSQLMTHFGGYFPFYFLKENEKDSVLIIGSGGGRDVVIALLGGVKSITAVEVNPDLVQMVKDYESFNGGIYTKIPNVQVVVAEGRNYIRNTDAKYDLITLAIPITKSSRSVEAYALTENYLFTVESLTEYLDHLTPEGRIVIVAHNDLEIYRLITLALTAFERRNVSQPEAMNHIYTIASDLMPTIVIKNQPFDTLEVVQRHALLHQFGFDRGSFFVPYLRQLVLGPDEQLGLDFEWRMFDQILVDISDGKLSLDELINAAIVDVGPVTDDSPFFYKFDPGLPKPFGLFSVLIVLTVGGVIGLLLIPKRPDDSPSGQRNLVSKLALYPELKTFLLVFFFLGIGFMLVEIALFQKLTLFLGQPVLALTVLLFSLLLGTGLGSLTSSLAQKRLGRAITFATLIIFLLVVAYALFLTDAFDVGLDPKITATLLLLPLGFVLGFPFPLSIRLMKQYGLGDSVHLMWGVNGIASVLGSALTMIIGILVGFSYALYLGAILYAGVGGLAILLNRPKTSIKLEPIIIETPNLEGS